MPPPTDERRAAYTERELARLGDAPRKALVQRDRAFFAAEARRPWMLAWTAAVSLSGLFVLGWSAAALWVFILLGLWSAVFQNLLKVSIEPG